MIESLKTKLKDLTTSQNNETSQSYIKHLLPASPFKTKTSLPHFPSFYFFSFFFLLCPFTFPTPLSLVLQPSSQDENLNLEKSRNEQPKLSLIFWVFSSIPFPRNPSPSILQIKSSSKVCSFLLSFLFLVVGSESHRWLRCSTVSPSPLGQLLFLFTLSHFRYPRSLSLHFSISSISSSP